MPAGAPLRHPHPPLTDSGVTLRAGRPEDVPVVAALGRDADDVRFGDVAAGRFVGPTSRARCGSSSGSASRARVRRARIAARGADRVAYAVLPGDLR
jgi:hypothetical protein